MKREIKFRVFDIEFNQMCQVSTLRSLEQDIGDKVEAHGLTAPFGYRDVKITKENQLLQFTGLLDKNGKEIYEGDILRLEPLPFIDDDTEKMGAVEWDNNRAAFNISGQIQVHPNSNWEIIGNIYEHEHLLK